MNIDEIECTPKQAKAYHDYLENECLKAYLEYVNKSREKVEPE